MPFPTSRQGTLGQPKNLKTKTAQHHTIKKLSPTQQSHYQRYVEEGHDQFVFFSSGSLGNFMNNARIFGLGEPPVVFFTPKERLARLGVRQEANQTLMRYYGEIRIEGRVPVNTASHIFIKYRKHNTTHRENGKHIHQFTIRISCFGLSQCNLLDVCTS